VTAVNQIVRPAPMDVLLKLVAMLVVASARALMLNTSKQANKSMPRRRAFPGKMLANEPTELFGDFNIEIQISCPERHLIAQGFYCCSRPYVTRCFF
jgi:hypothetical protein